MAPVWPSGGQQTGSMTDYMTARFNLADERMATMQQQIEQRLTIRLGAFMAIATVTLATLMTLLRG
jgi:hypothetical protein